MVGRLHTRRYRFASASLVWDDLVPLLVDHDHAQRVGRAVRLLPGAVGPRGVFRLASGLRPARALALGGLSVGVDLLDTTADPHQRGVTLIRRALLREVSLTATPTFDDARVALAASRA